MMKSIAIPPLTPAKVIERLQSLPDEIYLAEVDLLNHCDQLMEATRRMKDAETEILTRENSPIDGKNEKIREAQLNQQLVSWKETILEWQKSVERERIKVQRLKDQHRSMLAIKDLLRPE